MKQLPTAETVLDDVWRKVHKQNPNSFWTTSAEQAMIEFAKLHVQQALKEAAHKSECYNKSKFPGDENWVVDIESILNAYPLDQIK